MKVASTAPHDGPAPLSGPTAYEWMFAGLWPVLVGLGLGLFVVGAVRFTPHWLDTPILLVLTASAGGLVFIGFVTCGLGWLKIRKELRAGYTTIVGRPQVPRLDWRTGILLRGPGEAEPSHQEVGAARERARRHSVSDT